MELGGGDWRLSKDLSWVLWHASPCPPSRWKNRIPQLLGVLAHSPGLSASSENTLAEESFFTSRSTYPATHGWCVLWKSHWGATLKDHPCSRPSWSSTETLVETASQLSLSLCPVLYPPRHSCWFQSIPNERPMLVSISASASLGTPLVAGSDQIIFREEMFQWLLHPSTPIKK